MALWRLVAFARLRRRFFRCEADLERHALMQNGDTTQTLAMHLRLRANALDLSEQRVIVSADAVETYDMSVETARQVGALAHPGGFFHRVFLYHMALNGIQVVLRVA